MARDRHTVEDTASRVAAADARVIERQARLDRHQPDHDRLPGLYVELDRDLDARIERAGVDPAPGWAIITLGGRPDQPELAELWDHTVGASSNIARSTPSPVTTSRLAAVPYAAIPTTTAGPSSPLTSPTPPTSSAENTTSAPSCDTTNSTTTAPSGTASAL
ncbi:MAG: hypothetical protein R2749_06460 [Acidimicrobiales bacterium]